MKNSGAGKKKTMKKGGMKMGVKKKIGMPSAYKAKMAKKKMC